MKNLHKYVVSERYPQVLQTAGNLTLDNEFFLNKMGYTSIQLGVFAESSITSRCIRFIKAVYYGIKFGKNALVVFHLPIKNKAFDLLQKIIHFRGGKTVAIIVDIDGWRDSNTALLQKELQMLQRFNYIVAHNTAMVAALLKAKINKPIFSIELFDYVTNATGNKRAFSNKVCIAANFLKATFVYQLDACNNVCFNLYGLGINELKIATCKNVQYEGSFSSNELAGVMQGSFGLVWDGDSIETCASYYSLNNPHKQSFYLAAGLPLIVWHKSPFAKTVLKENIGLIIHSLSEIESCIQQVSVSEYDKMQEAVSKYQTLLTNGHYIQTVIETIQNKEAEVNEN